MLVEMHITEQLVPLDRASIESLNLVGILRRFTPKHPTTQLRTQTLAARASSINVVYLL